MGKNVLVISTSLRKGNSERLAEEFAKGAAKTGNRVEFITLQGKEIQFCRGCLGCLKTGACMIKDDAGEITEQMGKAQVIAFASPIYYYEMCGQMKTLLDRANCLYSADYQFRDIYFLSAAAEDEIETDKRAISGLQGWIDCFPRAELKGTVFAGGVEKPGDIADHPALKKAFEMGASIQ